MGGGGGMFFLWFKRVSQNYWVILLGGCEKKVDLKKNDLPPPPPPPPCSIHNECSLKRPQKQPGQVSYRLPVESRVTDLRRCRVIADAGYENRTLSEKTELNSEHYPKISIVTDGRTYALDSIVSTTTQKPVDTKMDLGRDSKPVPHLRQALNKPQR